MERVFVYGTLKRGGYNHYILNSSIFEQEIKTKEKYSMYSMGAFPFVLLAESLVQITGEVFSVTEEVLKRLDILEGYPYFYNREQILLEDGTRAWIYYLQEKDYEYPIIASGVWN